MVKRIDNETPAAIAQLVGTGASLSDVLAFLERQEESDNKTIELVSRLTGFAAVFLAASSFGLPAIALIAAKNELAEGFRATLRLFSRRDAPLPLQRLKDIQLAHCLITHVSIAEAVCSTLEKIADAKGVELIPWLTDDFGDNGATSDHAALEFLAPIPVPHPAVGLGDGDNLPDGLFSLAAQRTAELVRASQSGEDDQTEIEEIDVLLAALAGEAKQRYIANIVEVATQYVEFGLWLNLRDKDREGSAERLTHDVVVAHAEEERIAARKSDRSFSRLEALVRNMRSELNDSKAAEVLTELSARAVAELARPVVDDPQLADRSGGGLSFPTRRDAFVPQHFRTVRFEQGVTRLEDEAAWQRIVAQSDLGPFLLRFLISPFSLRGPLLLLGHPGSGKSLLTGVLTSILAPPHFNVIRVELRDAEPDADIQMLVEQAIRNQTGRKVSWPELSKSMESPPVVIFDGYDELLQATGEVHRSFLNRVQLFQERELQIGRPVGAIVTSRIALIDKASVPDGTTVLRLAEFSDSQIDEWVANWNQTNALYFEAGGVEPFSPNLADKGTSELARQPLLLLMLAIYDAQDNALARVESLRHGDLYENLLRRFILREQSKDLDSYHAKTLEVRERELENTIGELAAIAIGMFNRRSLASTAAEISQDLGMFGKPDESGEAGIVHGGLSGADLVVGSFFFVHESRAGDESDPETQFASFEFLHNTFGEYLAARFVVSNIVGVCATLKEFTPALKDQRTIFLNQLTAGWYGGLSYGAIHDRPVIAAMTRERFATAATQALLGFEIEPVLAEVVSNEYQRLLASADGVAALARASRFPSALVQIERAATYLANLLLVAAAATEDTAVTLSTGATSASIWDRGIGLLAAGFPGLSLAPLARVVEVRIDGGHLSVQQAQIGSEQLYHVDEFAIARALDNRRAIRLHARNHIGNGDRTADLASAVIRSHDTGSTPEWLAQEWNRGVGAKTVPLSTRAAIQAEKPVRGSLTEWALSSLWCPGLHEATIEGRFEGRFALEHAENRSGYWPGPFGERALLDAKGRNDMRALVFEVPLALARAVATFDEFDWRSFEPGSIEASDVRESVSGVAVQEGPVIYWTGNSNDAFELLQSFIEAELRNSEHVGEFPELVGELALVGLAIGVDRCDEVFRRALHECSSGRFSLAFVETCLDRIYRLQRRDLIGFLVDALPEDIESTTSWTHVYGPKLLNMVAAGRQKADLAFSSHAAISWASGMSNDQ